MIGVCIGMPLHKEFGPVKIYSPTESGRVWQVTWTPQGMRRQVKQRTNKEGAFELAREIRGQLKRGDVGRVHKVSTDEAEWIRLCRQLNEPERVLKEALERQESFGKRLTVAECSDRYAKEYDQSDRAFTRQDARSKANIIRKTLGARYLDSLTESDLEEWRSNLNGSNRHINNIHAHLRHMLERARVWGVVPKGFNPAREVAALKIPKKEPCVWEAMDLERSFQWYASQKSKNAAKHIAFLALGAFAGMRPSEIEGVSGERDGLHWEDIDFERKHIRIRPEVAGKLAEPRYITFSEKVASGLSEEIAGSMWCTLASWLEPIKQPSGPVVSRQCQACVSAELRNSSIIQTWPKDGLRHTWISSLLALGVHRDWIAELAGNSPMIIKTNYKRPLPEAIAKSWFAVRRP